MKNNRIRTVTKDDFNSSISCILQHSALGSETLGHLALQSRNCAALTEQTSDFLSYSQILEMWCVVRLWCIVHRGGARQKEICANEYEHRLLIPRSIVFVSIPLSIASLNLFAWPEKRVWIWKRIPASVDHPNARCSSLKKSVLELGNLVM